MMMFLLNELGVHDLYCNISITVLSSQEVHHLGKTTTEH